MRDQTPILEDRVRRAVDRLRSLERRRRELEAENRELRERLRNAERGAPAAWAEERGAIVEGLRGAIAELRGD